MRISRLAALALLLVPGAFADLTIDYKMSYQLAKGIPEQMAGMMEQQLAKSMPSGMKMQIKGDRLRSGFGALASIVDYVKGEITLMHPESKRYATCPIADYGKEMQAGLPAMAVEAMKQMQVDATAEKSGQNATIQGLATEEIVIHVTMEMPGMAGGMKMELHMWVATKDAIASMPELKAWDPVRWSSMGGASPAQMLGSSFAQGQAAEKLAKTIGDILKQSGGLTLRTESRVFIPMLGQMLASQGVNLGDGPLMTARMEADHIGHDAVPDSAFTVPEGFQKAPIADLMKTMIPTAPGGGQ